MTEYVVIVERGETGFGAYLPDVPGCVAAAETEEEVIALLGAALVDHLDVMRERGEPIPEPASSAVTLSVDTVVA